MLAFSVGIRQDHFQVPQVYCKCVCSHTSRRKRGLSGMKVSPTREATAGRTATRTNTRQLWNWTSAPILKPQPGCKHMQTHTHNKQLNTAQRDKCNIEGCVIRSLYTIVSLIIKKEMEVIFDHNSISSPIEN